MSGFRKWLLVKEEDAAVLDKENARVSNENIMHGVLTSVPKRNQDYSQISSTQHTFAPVRSQRVALMME